MRTRQNISIPDIHPQAGNSLTLQPLGGERAGDPRLSSKRPLDGTPRGPGPRVETKCTVGYLDTVAE